MEVSKTRFSVLTLDDDGVVVARPTDSDQPRDAAVIGEIVDGLVRLVGNEPRPALWFPGSTRIDPGGWQTLIDSVSRFATAVAIVVTAPDARPLGSFPGIVDSLILPVRVFADEQEARKWLLDSKD
jgi:hypothetical protein